MRDELAQNKNTGTGRERKEFLDILRVIAVCAVVLHHTVSGVLACEDLTGYERRKTVYQVMVDVTPWCVPIFLLISGYLFLNPKKDLTWRDMLGKYCRRILLALVIFGIPYSLLELVGTEKTFRLGMLWEAVRNTATGRSWAHMWYLYMLLILYAATPLLRWILKRTPAFFGYLVAVALFLAFSLVPFWENLRSGGEYAAMPGGGIILFYYLCGYLFMRKEKKADPRARGICLGLFALLLAAQAAVRIFKVPLADMAYSSPFTALQSIFLFYGLQVRCKTDRAKGVWKELSALSFGIYLIHPVFLNFFYKFLGISLMDFRFVIGVPLFYGIALLGAALVTWILRKIPALRRYVL